MECLILTSSIDTETWKQLELNSHEVNGDTGNDKGQTVGRLKRSFVERSHSQIYRGQENNNRHCHPHLEEIMENIGCCLQLRKKCSWDF